MNTRITVNHVKRLPDKNTHMQFIDLNNKQLLSRYGRKVRNATKKPFDEIRYAFLVTVNKRYEPSNRYPIGRSKTMIFLFDSTTQVTEFLEEQKWMHPELELRLIGASVEKYFK